MIFIKRKRAPKTFRNDCKKYKKEIKKYKGDNIKTDVFDNGRYEYFDKNVKDVFIKMSNYRCPICCRKMYDSCIKDKESGFLIITAEHIKPETYYPELIMSWENLLPCCNECNNKRDCKKIDNYLNPTLIKNIGDYSYYNYSGKIVPKDGKELSMSNMIDAYALNDNKLAINRMYFKNEVMNDYFDLLVSLEDGDESIIFLDIYRNEKKKKRVKEKLKCKVDLLE